MCFATSYRSSFHRYACFIFSYNKCSEDLLSISDEKRSKCFYLKIRSKTSVSIQKRSDSNEKVH